MFSPLPLPKVLSKKGKERENSWTWATGGDCGGGGWWVEAEEGIEGIMEKIK